MKIIAKSWREPGRAIAGLMLFAFVAAAIGIGVLLAPRLFEAIEIGTADDINKLLLAMAALAGVPFLVWRTWIADRQKHISQEELYTSLLTKAVEQLGATREEKTYGHPPQPPFSPDFARRDHRPAEAVVRTVPNTEVRLGAIYALEKLARDYLPLHWQIMEILCAYVRKNAGPPRPRSREIRAIYAKDSSQRSNEENAVLRRHERELKPFVDVQAALTVVGRRTEKQRQLEKKMGRNGKSFHMVCLDLSNCHLAGVNLRGMHFEGAILNSSCLERARLDDAHFEDARLFQAHLERARFDRAHLAGVWLIGAHLEGAGFDWTHLDDAMLIGAHLEGAWLIGARLERVFDVTQEQIDSAFGNENTTLPEGLTRPAHWTKSRAGERTAEEEGK